VLSGSGWSLANGSQKTRMEDWEWISEDLAFQHIGPFLNILM